MHRAFYFLSLTSRCPICSSPSGSIAVQPREIRTQAVTAFPTSLFWEGVLDRTDETWQTGACKNWRKKKRRRKVTFKGAHFHTWQNQANCTIFGPRRGMWRHRNGHSSKAVFDSRVSYVSTATRPRLPTNITEKARAEQFRAITISPIQVVYRQETTKKSQ